MVPLALVTAVGHANMYFLVHRMNQKRETMSIDERITEIDSGRMGDRHADFRYIL